MIELRRFGGLATLAYVLLAADRGLAQSPVTSDYRPALRSFKYLEKKDDFLRHESAVAPYLKDRPGGELSYHGNRLRQYRYVGSTGDGGYYDAWTEYVRRRKLDPKKYQYRLRD